MLFHKIPQNFTKNLKNINKINYENYHSYYYDDQGYWDKSGTYLYDNKKNTNYYMYCFMKVRTKHDVYTYHDCFDGVKTFTD